MWAHCGLAGLGPVSSLSCWRCCVGWNRRGIVLLGFMLQFVQCVAASGQDLLTCQYCRRQLHWRSGAVVGAGVCAVYAPLLIYVHEMGLAACVGGNAHIIAVMLQLQHQWPITSMDSASTNQALLAAWISDQHCNKSASGCPPSGQH